MVRFTFVLLSWLMLLTLPASAVPDLQPAKVAIEINSPQPGETVKNRVHMAPVRGAARSGSGKPIDFDVLIAIDVSHSTRYPSGIDVDEDEEIGFDPHEELIAPGTYPEDVVCSDPDDTILAAEIKAARYLVEVLSAGRTRVGIIAFSGEVDPKPGKQVSMDQKDAWVREQEAIDQREAELQAAKGERAAREAARSLVTQPRYYRLIVKHYLSS